MAAGNGLIQDTGTSAPRHLGTLALWHLGTLALWHSGTLALWHLGTLAPGCPFMIYLVHHASALDTDVDAQRPLSADGRAHAARLAAEVARRGVRPDVIWHSGKLRARQTADAFRSACNPLAEFSAIRGLQPGDPPEWIRDRVTGDDRELMLVGHFPSLPRILHALVSGLSDGESDDFPLHGVVALEPEGSLWTVRWEAGRA